MGRARVAKTLAACGVAAGLLVLLGPTQLGGSTMYSTTTGNSMEPRFHTGDLAIVRAASHYRVGDIVLYRSPVLDRPVLHRIITIQDGRYYFKGDHNDFVDPGFATRGELLGKLWIRVPKLGKVLAWFGRPSHSAVLAGAAVLFLAFGGGAAAAQRRRRRRESVRRPLVGMQPQPSYAKALTMIAACALGAAAVLLAVGFTHPLKRTVPLSGAYVESGRFEYSARLTKPSSLFPTGVAHTGQPLFFGLFDRTHVAFAYTFSSRLSHSVHGTIALRVTVASTTSSWQHQFVLRKPISFTGDHATVAVTAQLRALRTLITQLAVASGDTGGDYQVTLEPDVSVDGLVGGRRVRTVFNPPLPFTLTDTTLQVNPPPLAVLPGATYTAPAATAALRAVLTPTTSGSIPTTAANFARILRFRIAVNVVRGLGLGFLGLALVFLILAPWGTRRRLTREERIAGRHSCVIVEVVALEAAGVPRATVAFDQLVTLARYLDRPILHEPTAGTYAVEDGNRLYVAMSAPTHAGSASQPSRRRMRSPRRLRLGRAASTTLGLMVVAGLITSFTATDVVPLSRASDSNLSLDLSQLAPAQCSSLSLTHLVVAKSSTVTGTSGNDLILGRNGSGANTLDGGGGTDCIVAGGSYGTTNQLNGGQDASRTVCVGAPNASNSFSNCSRTYN
jgi:signal peptidase I